MNGFGAHLNSIIDEWRSPYRGRIRSTLIKNHLLSKIFDDRLMNLFYYVHQKKIYYSIVYTWMNLFYYLGNKNNEMHFNLMNIRQFVLFCYRVFSLLIFILSFKFLLHFNLCSINRKSILCYFFIKAIH